MQSIWWIKKLVLLCASSVIFLCFQVIALELNQWYITDEADILLPQTEATLTQQLTLLEEETGAQVIVVTIVSLDWRDPFDVAFNLAQYETDTPDPDRFYEDWDTGVWDSTRDNGLLLLVAPNDRKRYSVAWRWLEWALPDVYLKRLWEWVLVPAFRAEDYNGWVIRFVEIVDGIIRGEYVDKPFDQSINPSNSREGAWINVFFLGMFLTFMFWWLLKKSRTTDKQKYQWSLVASWLYSWLAAVAWLWLAGLLMAIPLYLIWMLVLFGKLTSGSWWSSGYWGWGFSWGWSFGWGFGWFGWGSFSGWWAWWSR